MPAQMYAWTIRRERHDEPDRAMQVKVEETPTITSGKVLVLVMRLAATTTVFGRKSPLRYENTEKSP